MKNIKAIIFDLGGVILNINYQNTIDSFKKLGVKNTANFYSKKTQSNIFNLIETGEITTKQFLNDLQELTDNATIKEVKKMDSEILMDQIQDAMMVETTVFYVGTMDKAVVKSSVRDNFIINKKLRKCS